MSTVPTSPTVRQGREAAGPRGPTAFALHSLFFVCFKASINSLYKKDKEAKSSSPFCVQQLPILTLSSPAGASQAYPSSSSRTAPPRSRALARASRVLVRASRAPAGPWTSWAASTPGRWPATVRAGRRAPRSYSRWAKNWHLTQNHPFHQHRHQTHSTSSFISSKTTATTATVMTILATPRAPPQPQPTRALLPTATRAPR